MNPGRVGRSHCGTRRRLGACQRSGKNLGQTGSHRVLHRLGTGGLQQHLGGVLGQIRIELHLALGHCGTQAARDRIELGRGRASRVGLPSDALAQQIAHDVEIVTAHSRYRQHLNSTEAVLLEQGADVVEQARQPALREGIHLVDQDEHVLLTGPQPTQIAVVEGRISVLLRIDDPHEDIGQRYEPVHLQGVLRGHRVVVGDIEQNQPGHASLVLGVKNRVPSDPPF